MKKIYFLINSEAAAAEPTGDLLKRLRAFGYTFISISKPEEIASINQPEAKLAIVNIESEEVDKTISKLSKAFKERFPQIQQLGVFSGVLNYDQNEILDSDIDVIYQYPFDDELIINHCFEADPVDLDNSQLTYSALARVNVVELKAGDKLPFGLYVYLPANAKIIPYNHKDFPLDEEVLNKFKENSHYNLYVKKSELGNYYKYCASSISKDKARLNEEEYLQEVNKKMKGLMSGFFDQSNQSSDMENAQLLDNLGKIVSQLEDASGSKLDLMKEVNKVAAKQMTNYSHAKNMATYCAMFGMMAGINEPQSLRIGGMLHDLGMMDLPINLLHKELEDMDEMEMAQFKLHPGNSKLSVVEKGIKIPKSVENMIMQHHEHMDGSGFPYGLKSEEIDPFAKICAFADVFDSLTSVREGYRQLSPMQAMAKISGMNGENPHPIFDPNFHQQIVDAFIDGQMIIPTFEEEPSENLGNQVAKNSEKEAAVGSVGEIRSNQEKSSYGKVKGIDSEESKEDSSETNGIKKDLGEVLGDLIDDDEGAA